MHCFLACHKWEKSHPRQFLDWCGLELPERNEDRAGGADINQGSNDKESHNKHSFWVGRQFCFPLQWPLIHKSRVISVTKFAVGQTALMGFFAQSSAHWIWCPVSENRSKSEGKKPQWQKLSCNPFSVQHNRVRQDKIFSSWPDFGQLKFWPPKTVQKIAPLWTSTTPPISTARAIHNANPSFSHCAEHTMHGSCRKNGWLWLSI